MHLTTNFFMKNIVVPNGKKVYFASDNHLGAPTMEQSMPREKKFVAWLDEIKEDAAAIFLLGDLLGRWVVGSFFVLRSSFFASNNRSRRCSGEKWN